MEREAQFNAIVGAPRHGKSTFCMKLIKSLQKVHSNILVYKHVTSINDPAFKEIKRVPFRTYNGGVAKIDSYDIGYKQFIKEVNRKFRNGALFVDDAINFERNTISDDMLELISIRAHLGLDVFYIYHGLTAFPIDQFPFLNNIILFHTSDNINYKGPRLPGIEKLQAAKDRVYQQRIRGNKYYHEFINLQ